jgi:acetyl-CoA carboxylase carboxyl transferase subunit alpha
MLQYSTYSVISPEGCAAILWKDAAKASEAAEALQITAPKLKALGLVDKVLNEPLGGAHRDPKAMALTLKKAIADALKSLADKSPEKLVQERQKKILQLGRFKELEI